MSVRVERIYVVLNLSNVEGASKNVGGAALARQNSMKTGGADPRVYAQ
ncbi:Uncharacterised protein [BD1-7 clade bacterium]|nr:Uncharacterised protein [BD1-7 clade bacterium]